MAMYRKPIVPDTFEIPQELVLSNCILLPLTIDISELDYAAVMDMLDENGNTKYPKHTLYQNTVDLGYHQKEFQKRASFTYTILNNTKNECLGCLYMYPCDDVEYDVEIDMWIRNKYSNIEKEVMGKVKEWIKNVWPFEKPKFIF